MNIWQYYLKINILNKYTKINNNLAITIIDCLTLLHTINKF